MNSPRWKKIIRDLQSAQGRMAMMVIAIAVSIFAVGMILTAYTVLSREMSRNYFGTNPASAFINNPFEEICASVKSVRIWVKLFPISKRSL